MAYHLQMDADPDPDPAYHFGVDPDPDYHFDADPDPVPDPTVHFSLMRILADPDPQHWPEAQLSICL
jgi:hypothetical protein